MRLARELTFAVALLLGLTAEAAPPSRPTLGVLDVTAGTGISGDFLDICNETLREVAVRSSRYRVQDRAQMQTILNEQKFNASDKCDESCAVDAGRVLQVAFLLSGSLRKLDTTYFVTARLTDVTTGEVIGTQTSKCDQCTLVQVVSTVRNAAARLLGVAETEGGGPSEGEAKSEAKPESPGLFSRIGSVFRSKKSADPETAALPAAEVAPPSDAKAETPTLKAAPEPPPATTAANVVFRVSEAKAIYQLALAPAGGMPQTCLATRDQPCVLASVPFGPAMLEVTGDHDLHEPLKLQRPEAAYRIDQRGRWPLIFGSVVGGAGVLGIASGYGPAVGVGALMAVGGASLVLYDVFRWHARVVEEDR